MERERERLISFDKFTTSSERERERQAGKTDTARQMKDNTKVCVCVLCELVTAKEMRGFTLSNTCTLASDSKAFQNHFGNIK